MVQSKNLQGKRKCNIDGDWQPSGKPKIHQEILCYQDLITWTIVLVHLRLNVADEANEGSNRLTLAFLKTSSHRCNSNLCVLFNLGLVSLPAHQLLRLFLLVSRLSPPCISLFPPWLRLWLVSSSSSSAALISAASRKAAEILSKLKIESCVKYPPATS